MSVNKKKEHALQKGNKREWCLVDVDGYFTYGTSTYWINDSVEEYQVFNKYSEKELYTNEAYMDKVLVVENEEEGEIYFFNQNFYPIADTDIEWVKQ